MNALPLIAVGAGLLLLSRKRDPRREPIGGDTITPEWVEEKNRIIEESRDIVQGKRDSYSDDPGTKVEPREAAQRVKETIEAAKPSTGKVTNAGNEAAAIAAARNAAEQEALKATGATKPTGKVTQGPIGVSMSVNHAQQWLNYLGAKLAVDGKYGPKTRDAWAHAAAQRGYTGRFDRGSATTAMVDADARDAIKRDAEKAKAAGAKPKPTPAPKPVQVVVVQQPAPAPTPSGPTPPPGFDRTKAANSAPDVAKNVANKKYDYSRGALKIWQKLAGIAQDGIYGNGSAAAMRYYVGPSAPKSLFPKQGENHYPWGD